jgi:hypothetical protein
MNVLNDFKHSRPFGLFDIFNHLIYHSLEYDKQSLAAYKYLLHIVRILMCVLHARRRLGGLLLIFSVLVIADTGSGCSSVGPFCPTK